VPDEASAAGASAGDQAAHPRQLGAPGGGASERNLVRDALGYLAACLPPGLGAETRLLALQCSLRADSEARVLMPTGLLRGMRLAGDTGPWHDLEDAWWAQSHPVAGGMQVQLVASAGAACPRAHRVRAADWALRVCGTKPVQGLSASLCLAGLVLSAYCVNGRGIAHAQQLALLCGQHGSATFRSDLDELVSAGVLYSWTPGSDGSTVRWCLCCR
jgi:hypothetical protein